MLGDSDSRDAITKIMQDGTVTVDGLGTANLLARVEERLFNRAWTEVKLSRYVVLHRLGRGAFGSVYAAYDPELDRKVAIKLLTPRTSEGSGDEGESTGRDRLLREAQALARFSHPNVVTVHDVGTYELDEQAPMVADARVPMRGVFIVMEFIDGHRLDDWLAAEPRSWGNIVARFIEAGRGLSAAHAKGIVHRDFKPANVLVDRLQRAKVVDFGLARSQTHGIEFEAPGASHTDESCERLRRDTLSKTLTQTGALLGTPLYMAPEQHRGTSAQAASDQFAFCVTLYQGLYGRYPYAGDDLDAIVRAKLQHDILPAPKGSYVPARFFDIIKKGLSPEPHQRFGSMEALMAALVRLPTTRRRAALAMVGLTCAAGLTAVAAAASRSSNRSDCEGFDSELEGVWDETMRSRVGSAFDGTGLPYATATWNSLEPELELYADAWLDSRQQLCEASRGRDRLPDELVGTRMLCLEQQRRKLGELMRLFTSADADILQAATVMVADLGSPASCLSDRAHSSEPLDEAERDELLELEEQLALAEALGRTLRTEEALSLAIEVQARAQRTDSERLQSRANLAVARAQAQTGEYTAARDAAKAALELAERLRDDDATFAATTTLLEIATDAGEYERAEVIAELSSSRLEAARVEPRTRATHLYTVGVLRIHQGRYEDATARLERARDIMAELYGAEHPLVGRVFNALGSARSKDARYDQALEAYRRAMDIFGSSLGDDHPEVGKVHNNIANVWLATGRFEQARAAFERAIAIWQTSLPAHHPMLATGYGNLALVYERQGRRGDALEYFDRALTIQQAVLGAEHPSTQSSLQGKATCLSVLGKPEQALELYERVLPAQRERLGADHPDTLETMSDIARTLLTMNRLEEASAMQKEALDAAEQRWGRDHSRLGRHLLTQAQIEEALGRVSHAQELRRRVLTLLSREQDETHPGILQSRLDLGTALLREGDHLEAIEQFEQALDGLAKDFGPEHGRLAWPLAQMGLARFELGDVERARANLERAIILMEGYEGPPLQPSSIRFALARVLVDTDAAQARPLAERARRDARALAPDDPLAAEIGQWMAEHGL